MADVVLTRIDVKIEQVLAAPDAWGGAAVLEPMTLMLLQLRAETVEGGGDGSDAGLLRRYREYLARRVGKGALPLLERLAASGNPSSPADVLRGFWQDEVARAKPAPAIRTRERLFDGEVEVDRSHIHLIPGVS